MKKQHGVTLIELMVSMMLGLALVAGISQLFIQSQKSFRLQRNVSDMTDDGSFLLEVLAKSILLAGYSQDGTKNYPTSTNAVFSVSGSPSVPDITFSDVDEYIHGIDDDAKGDQLVYRYKLNDLNELSNSACTNFTELKNAASSGKTVTVRIYRKYDLPDSDTDVKTFVLYCKPAIDNVSKDAQPLVSEVEKLVFKYGVRKLDLTCADLATPTIPGYCFYYTDATTITAGDLWKNIFSVKVFVVLRSVDENLTRNQTSYKIEGIDQMPNLTNPDSTTNKKRLYKVFSKTIYLRVVDQ